MNFPEIGTSEKFQMTVSEAIVVPDLINLLESTDVADAEIILPDSTADSVQENFPYNSKLASFVDDNGLNFYSTETTPLPTAILDGESVYYLVRMNTVKQFVEFPSSRVETLLCEEFASLSEAATPIEFDIPAWDELLEQLEEVVDHDTRVEFERLIEAARIDNVGALDETSVAIIAAAQSGALMYDLGKWAEDVGLASKATVSRRKNILEEDGIIYTEKVPIDVGRPRLRLQLAGNINAVNIEEDEIDVSRSRTAADHPSQADRQDRSSQQESSKADESKTEKKSEQSDKSATEEDDILMTIEEEVRDVISSN